MATSNLSLTAELKQEQRQKKIDSLLNKTFLDIGVFSALGWTLGIGAGLFFHKAAPIRNLFAGIGGSYGFVNNRVHLKQFA
jgi:hypothetical protein